MRQNLIALALATALGSVSMAARADVNTVAGGVLFIDFTNIDQKALGKDTAAAGSGLDVKRGYITIDHKFDDFWSANLTTDFNFQSTLQGGAGQTSLFVKKAYLQAKWSNEFMVRAGAADTPWIGFVDGLSGMRYLDSSAVDKYGFGNSSDWGIHALGTGGDGFWTYSVALLNGGGYRNPTRSNSMDVEGRVSISPIKGLTLAAGGYSGKLGQDPANLDPLKSTRTFTRTDLLAAYNTADLRLGVEYFTTDNNKGNVQYTLSSGSPFKDSAEGYSAWGWYSFAKDWAVIGRYDHIEPKQDTVKTQKDEYEFIGLEYAPRKGIKIAGVYKHERLKDGLFPTKLDTKTNEIGVWAEVKF